MKEKLIIGIPGAGESSDSFNIIKPNLKKQGYELFAIPFHDYENPEESILKTSYKDYREILKETIESFSLFDFKEIQLLTHSHGASIVLDYLVKEKNIPTELTKLTCMSPMVSYFSASDLPKNVQKYGKSLTNFLYSASKITGAGNIKLNTSGINGVRLSTALSYLNHSLSIYKRKKAIEIPTRFYLPEFDNNFNETSKERENTIINQLSITEKDKINFHTFKSKDHDDWYIKFNEIFKGNF